MSSLFPSLTLLCLLATECRGDCARSPTISEAMGITPYRMWEGDDLSYLDIDLNYYLDNDLIAKFAFTYDENGDAKKVSTDPCSFKVYQRWDPSREDGEGYVNINMVPVYTIQEIFVGGNTTTEGGGGVTVGDEIPILYSTDTGDREDLPSRLNDTEGFLGVLNRVGYCFVGGEYVEASSIVHTMNDCNFLSNIPWSDVSEEDRELLRGGELEVASNAFSSTLASFRSIIILVAVITLF